jgi:hypothetical protein
VPEAQSLADSFGVAGSGDYNGDGLTDLYIVNLDSKLRAGPGHTQDKVWLSKGNMTFDVVNSVSAANSMPEGRRIVGSGDFNGDGLTDHYVFKTRAEHAAGAANEDTDYILRAKGDGTFEKISLIGNGGITTSYMNYEVKGSGDFDGDALTDLYLFDAKGDGRYSGSNTDKLFTPGWEFPDQLAGVTNGLGLNSQLVYKPLTDTTVYTKGTGSTYPVQETIAPRHVVAQVKADNGVGGQNTQTYKYEAMRTHVADLGGLGFAKMVVTDDSSGIRTESVYSQDWANNKQGLLLTSKTITPAPGNVILEEQTLTWGVATATTTDSTPLRFRYLPTTVTVKKDLNGSLLSTVTETTAYDNGSGNYFANYGFPRQVAVATVEPDNSATYTQTTVNTYTHDATNWILGRLTAATVTHQATGKTNIVRSSSFTYDTRGHLLTETVEPSSSTLFYTKTYGYHDTGVVTTLTETWGTQNNASIKNAAGTTASNRVTTYGYDSRYRNKTSTTNALSQGETTAYDAVTGVATSTTGPNNLVSRLDRVILRELGVRSRKGARQHLGP